VHEGACWRSSGLHPQAFRISWEHYTLERGSFSREEVWGRGDSSARRRHQKGHRICVNSLLSTKYDDVGNVLCQGESKNERHPFLRKPVCFESSTKCSHKHLPNFMHSQ